MRRKRFYIIAATKDGARWYWFISGLWPNREDAEPFPSRAEAFAVWNDHSADFPGWEAEILEAA